MTTTHEDQRASKHPQAQNADGDQAAVTHVSFSRALASRRQRASAEKYPTLQNPSSTSQSSHMFSHGSMSTAQRRTALVEVWASVMRALGPQEQHSPSRVYGPERGRPARLRRTRKSVRAISAALVDT